MTAYYNENDPKAAAWLRELIKQGHIAKGVVDDRSIADVRPDELVGYTQCHFFAGIGVWSYALRCAGWPDDRPVWTGSCPCQPFSAAGQGEGFADERHLWPAWDCLIGQCRPRVIFGEQVESAILHGWLDLVQSDLEGKGYAFGPVGLPAAGFGAPHIRQRLYFVADAASSRCNDTGEHESRPSLFSTRSKQCGDARPVANAEGVRSGEGYSNGRRCDERSGEEQGAIAVRSIDAGHLADPELPGSSRLDGICGKAEALTERVRDAVMRHRGPCNGFWHNAEWIPCRDGKARPTQPGIFPLVDGASARVVRGGDSGASIDPDATTEARVMRLRGYGNAIVAPVAEAFIHAYMEVRG